MMIDNFNCTSLRRNGLLVWTEESGKEYPHVWSIVEARIKSVQEETPVEVVVEVSHLAQEEVVEVKAEASVGGLSKKERALLIFKQNPQASRGEIIELFMKELNMTKAGASTYHANCKKI
jgi:hypothetical protein